MELGPKILLKQRRSSLDFEGASDMQRASQLFCVCLIESLRGTFQEPVGVQWFFVVGWSLNLGSLGSQWSRLTRGFGRGEALFRDGPCNAGTGLQVQAQPYEKATTSRTWFTLCLEKFKLSFLQSLYMHSGRDRKA